MDFSHDPRRVMAVMLPREPLQFAAILQNHAVMLLANDALIIGFYRIEEWEGTMGDRSVHSGERMSRREQRRGFADAGVKSANE